MVSAQDFGLDSHVEKLLTVDLDHEWLDNIVPDYVEVGVTDPVRDLRYEIRADGEKKKRSTRLNFPRSNPIPPLPIHIPTQPTHSR